jgi:hypothetical protein
MIRSFLALSLALSPTYASSFSEADAFPKDPRESFTSEDAKSRSSSPDPQADAASQAATSYVLSSQTGSFKGLDKGYSPDKKPQIRGNLSAMLAQEQQQQQSTTTEQPGPETDETTSPSA